MSAPRNWRPGSFTKNLGWGTLTNGLSELHRAISAAFGDQPIDVRRDVARSRIISAGVNDLLVADFFLYNHQNGLDYIAADELVKVALSRQHSNDFDRLAAFALNLSMAGSWGRAKLFQRYPAEWAKHFVANHLYSAGHWEKSKLNALEIQNFISSSPLYSGVWAKKVATNLNYIYQQAKLAELTSGLTESWWGSAIFLALDRISADRGWTRAQFTQANMIAALSDEFVFELTCVRPEEGVLASKELLSLYVEDRFSTKKTVEHAKGRTNNLELLPEDGIPKEASPVERIYAMASRQVRDRRLVQKIRSLYQDKCCVCGNALSVGDGLTFSEIGHIVPVGLPFKGMDHESNVLPFCPNHHRQFDRGGVVFEVSGKQAKVVERFKKSKVDGRRFAPAAGHGLEMSHLSWHANFFEQKHFTASAFYTSAASD